MLVTTGQYNNGNSEIIRLNSNDAKVPTYPNLSKYIVGATGGFIGEKMLICGGSIGDSDDSISRECYLLHQVRSIDEQINMKKNRKWAASIVMGNKLWILGGMTGEHGSVSDRTSEFIDIDGHREDGPDLPAGLERHAVVKINETTAMLLGGYPAYNFKKYSKTWYYTQHQTEWIPGPNLNHARCSHTAGLIYDSITQEEYVVVIGGIGNSGNLKSIEYLSRDGSEWKEGKLAKYFSISILKI